MIFLAHFINLGYVKICVITKTIYKNFLFRHFYFSTQKKWDVDFSAKYFRIFANIEIYCVKIHLKLYF